jgi:DHA2 family multidrug resistance protein
MAMLFVPLTTITMDPIRKEEMGNATSMFNFMRNIGGSVGIATATTLIARDSQRFTNILGAHVSPYNAQAQRLMEQLRHGFMSRGSDAATAAKEAYAATFGLVQQQASLLSYLNAFRFFGIVFLVLLPLILPMRRPSQRSGAVALH